LIEIKGKSDGVGRPLLYGTSKKFMEYFGLNSLTELPNPKDFSTLENTIGTELDPNFNDFAQFGLMEGEGAQTETNNGVETQEEIFPSNHQEEQPHSEGEQSGEENNIDQETNGQQEEGEQ